MKRRYQLIIGPVALAVASACSSGAGPGTLPPSETVSVSHSSIAHNGGSLGPVLSTSDGGQIFGFDVDQNGNDGLLASATANEVSVQTFDATSGKITKTLGVHKGTGVQKGNDYVVDGIFARDVGLVDFQKAGIPGQTPTKDHYSIMSPVTANKFTGRWTPPVKLFNVLQTPENQSTTTSVVFGYPRVGSDATALIVSDVGKNTFGKVIQLNQNDFALGAQPQLAQDTVNNRAVMATSPSFGRVGGPPPDIFTFDLKSGKMTELSGVNCPDGGVGCGFPNGVGYDSKTGIACTTTELDAGVEIYNVPQKTGFWAAQLPVPPSGVAQFYSGTYVANDPIHQLFLIAQPHSGSSSSGSSIQVYDETGHFVESINGFNFTDAGDLVIPIKIAINPSARTGWVNGPGVNQLQEFAY